MQKIDLKDSLEEYQKKMAHNRRVLAQAKAVLTRAKSAGIPEKYMRINQATFQSILDPEYHNDIERVSNYIFKTPIDVLNKEFIIIDGGGVVERKMAGFAILFRLIACDKYGLHRDIGSVAHAFQTLTPDIEGLHRNELAEVLRSAEILFLSEFNYENFRKGFETGRFFDDVLTYRDDYVKTTIISMFSPLPKTKIEEDHTNLMTEQGQYGIYMCSATQADQTKDPRFFRIRVKQNGRK